MYDVIIIGAGPAGLSAAIVCAENELDVLIIDEFMFAGGRLLGQLYEESKGRWWNGIEESRKLAEKAIQLGINIQLNTSVVNIEKHDNTWNVYTEEDHYTTNRLLLATGAAESPVPVPGWTLPGVMSIGAAQVMTNVHRVKPGKKGIIIGLNVLSAAIAMELKLAGIEVHSIALPKSNIISKSSAHPEQVLDSLLHISHLAPNKFIQLGSKLMKHHPVKKMGITLYPKNGVKLWGIPIHLKKAVVKICGTHSVESVILARINRNGEIIPNSEESIPVDFVCIAGGLYPLAELAALSGCPFYHVKELGGYVPLHSEKMETTIEGLYVAGNITGIEGSKVAIAQGVTAGLTIVQNFGKNNLDQAIEKSIQNIEAVRNEAAIQFHPNIKTGKRKVYRQWKQYKLNQEDYKT